MSDQPFAPNYPDDVPSQYGTNVPGYVPPVPDAATAPSSGDAGSTAEVAKSQAADVAGGAKDAAQQVAATAKEQAGEVVQEAKSQVRQVVGQAQSELSDQAQTQQTKAAAGLHSLGDQLAAMAKGSDQPGVATGVARQAADRAHQFADWLEDRDPQGVLDEARSFARRKPGVFLVAALGAGVLAGRLARGMSAGTDNAASASPATKAAHPTRSEDSSHIAGTAAPGQLTSSSSEELVDRLGAQDFGGAPGQYRGDLPGADE